MQIEDVPNFGVKAEAQAALEQIAMIVPTPDGQATTETMFRWHGYPSYRATAMLCALHIAQAKQICVAAAFQNQTDPELKALSEALAQLTEAHPLAGSPPAAALFDCESQSGPTCSALCRLLPDGRPHARVQIDEHPDGHVNLYATMLLSIAQAARHAAIKLGENAGGDPVDVAARFDAFLREDSEADVRFGGVQPPSQERPDGPQPPSAGGADQPAPGEPDAHDGPGAPQPPAGDAGAGDGRPTGQQPPRHDADG